MPATPTRTAPWIGGARGGERALDVGLDARHLLGQRRIVTHVALEQPHTADVQTDRVLDDILAAVSAAAADDLGAATPDVEYADGPRGHRKTRQRTVERELRLLVAGDHARPHAEQRLGLVEELGATRGVAQRAGADGCHVFDAERAELARVALETGEGASRGLGRERASRIHVFTQASDGGAFDHCLEHTRARLGDQQQHRVGADVDRRYPRSVLTWPGSADSASR